jgi:membrane-associated protease RseP (regulator of RpoE activity)
MVSFIVYDLVFLVLFTLAVVLFLYRRRENLERQGLLYLYKTKWGIRFIEWTSRKFPKTLYAMQYVVLISGFTLMIGMVYFLFWFSYYYLTSPFAAEALKVPVIIPLVPYLPMLFKLDFLPPFYFTYWILIIAIIAIPHEFAHGIFARINKIRIHSTGFGFLGPFLAAFVEPDEPTLAKRSKFAQMSVLAAGTFANVVFTVIFGVIFWLFFVSAFTPAGVLFNSYATGIIPLNEIDSINGKLLSEGSGIIDLIGEENFTTITIEDTKYFIPPNTLRSGIERGASEVPVYLDSPAFNAKLSGAITSIDGEPLRNFDDLKNFMDKHKPGDNVVVSTVNKDGAVNDLELELGNVEGRAFLGIGISPVNRGGILGGIYNFISNIKDPFVYYESKFGDLGWFIYNLLWWSVLISMSVALVNMIPLGIFDGGRFFMLTVWGLTGSKKFAEKAFKFSTWFILLLVAALMVRWLFIFI